MATDRTHADPSLRLSVGREQVVIDNRYETASIVNDVLIAVFFTVGSVLFFFDSTQTAGTWLFLLGSLDFLARPVIRLSRRTHLRRLGHRSAPTDRDYDY
ncbi:YrhK family protein [Rhodococcus sp. LW-XY12]|uniref:YrhK family protein n=1 Tax=Rhodococcus sp. LW-XY12 TaxID=2856851 RepID=UPI001C55AE1C|nr:YrhK family protein [Rhodococcus sp. LW-XY12]QXU56561.1 YrhK family protein [Rhodococcus sp. LW-XY12]